MIVLLSLLNALAVSFSNVFGGLASRRMPLTSVMIVAGPSALVIALLLAGSGDAEPTARGLAVGLLAGIVGGAGVPLAYRALALGPVGVAATIIACISTGIVATTGMALGSAVTPLRIAGLALCVVAIVLVSARGGEAKASRGVGLLIAAAAGAAFGFFAVTMNAAPAEDGWWPLVSARAGVVIIAVVMMAALVRRSRSGATAGFDVRRGAALIAVAAGVLDVTGNLFLVLALREGDLLLVAIITSVAPVVTATLGWLLLRERLGRLQLAGIVAAVFAVAATSI